MKKSEIEKQSQYRFKVWANLAVAMILLMMSSNEINAMIKKEHTIRRKTRKHLIRVKTKKHAAL